MTMAKGPFSLLAYDKSGVPYLIPVDTDGNIPVEVKLPATLTVQSKDNDKLFGMADVLREYKFESSLSGGDERLASNVVPAGQVWVVTQISWQYIGTVPGSVALEYQKSTSYFTIEGWTTVVSTAYYGYSCFIVIDAGSSIQMHMRDATAGDDARLTLLGYKMNAP